MSKPRKQGVETSLAGFLASLKLIEHSQKLNFVAKGIVKIGNAIPPQYKDAKVLYLSRNNLKSLDNVQQFTNLRAFSAADNLLPSFSSVASLQDLTALEAVSLEGNPVTDLPNYRHRVICMLSSSPLNQLDGKAVTLEDKEIAIAVCAVEDALLSLAVSTTGLINSFARAQLLLDMHDEMHLMYFRQQKKESSTAKEKYHRQKCISRLVSYFEQQRTLSLELDDADSKAEKQEIEAKFVTKAIAWHERALKSSTATATAGGKSSTFSWHAAYCRILADQAAQLENMVRCTTQLSSTNTGNGEENTSTNVASIFLSIRQALQQLAKEVRPVIDKNAAEHAEDLRKRVIELQSNLVQQLNSSDGIGEVEGDDFNNWLIPAAAPIFSTSMDLRPTPTLTTTKSIPSLETVPNNGIKDMLTLAAQHIVATEAVAQLERSLQEAEIQAEELSQKVAATEQKAEIVEAEYQLLRQEQVAAKEANTALQNWLEIANKDTEAAKNQVEDLETDLSQAHEMHAAEVAKVFSLQSQKESLQRQVEETQAMLLNDAHEHENTLFKLESEIAFLQQDKHRLEEQLEAALLATEIAKQQPQPVKLEINVFLARELQLEKAKNAELQEEAAAVAAQLDAVLMHQREQAAAAEELLLAKEARKAELERLKEYGITMQARRIAAAGFAAWRLAAQRSKKLTALELQKTRHVRYLVFSSWINYTKSALLLRLLSTAAVASAKLSSKQKVFAAWRATAANLRYQLDAELIETDPCVQLASELFHNRYVTSPFRAWRDLTEAEFTNSEALVVFSVAQRESENLKEAFTVWKNATEIHRQQYSEISRGIAARKVVFSRQVLRAWQRATRRATALAIAEAAATRASKRALLATTLAAWVDCRNNSAEEAVIVQEREEFQALEALQREIAFLAAEKKAENRARAASRALQRHIFSSWRTEVAYVKHIDAISVWCASSRRRQLLLKSLGSWRAAVYSDQVEELAQQLGQVEASLRVASSEIVFKEQEFEDCNASRLSAVSRVEELEATVARFEEQLVAAAEEASSLQRRVQQAEAAQRAAEELKEQAVLGAEAAVALEQQARRDAVDACHQAEEEREKAISNALYSSSEAAAAVEACKAAEKRAQAAEESRVEAEIVAIDALESVEAAASACERLAEECAGLHIALNEANQRYSTLQERYTLATETINTLTVAEERSKAEQADLEQQLQAVQRRWREAEEAKEVAESDAHVAMRQSQRLAEILEQHVQNQEHPLALIYK